MHECRFAEHDWNSTTDRVGHTQTARVRCGRCGVGNTFKLDFQPNGVVEAHMTIFAADGADGISREIVRFFSLIYGKTCEQARGDGLNLIEATPEINGVLVGI